MGKKTLLFVFLLFGKAYAQNAVIDTGAVRKWKSLGDLVSITNDGKYFLYNINNSPVESSTLIIQATDNSWEKRIVNAQQASFTNNCLQAVFQENDTLKFLTLGSDRTLSLANIKSFKVSRPRNCEWLAYQLKNSHNDLFIINPSTGDKQVYQNVSDYYFNTVGNVLLLKAQENHNDILKSSLIWVDLTKEKFDTIYSTETTLGITINVNNYVFDVKGDQLVFSETEKKSDKLLHTIWYYNVEMKKAVTKVTNQTSGIDPGLLLTEGGLQFSKNGHWIFFQLRQEIQRRTSKQDDVSVDVWSYKDVLLQSQQLIQTVDRKFTASINTNGHQVVRLEYDNENAEDLSNSTGDFAIIEDKIDSEPWWQSRYGERSYYLLSLSTGSRKLLKRGDNYRFKFSPTGRYLIYFDVKQKNYFSYDLVKGVIRNVSKAIPFRLWYNNEGGSNIEIGIAGWLENDDAILIYDDYDIWKLDPQGIKPPINVTNSYGRSHHLKLGLVYGMDFFSNSSVFHERDTLLLTAFNDITKYNGLCQMSLGEKKKLDVLRMGPYHLYHAERQKPFLTEFELARSMRPLKARDVDIWIVKRMTASEAPNFFLTKNFKEYTALTNIQPQKVYNWLTAELITWKQLDGTSSQGILYRPENFDPNKKYPIIFYYYEKLSHCLYQFPQPNISQGPINIPWFVSHGYLVFTPDIHYKIGKSIAHDICNSVVSAAEYLSTIPYVDKLRMGVQGHSFGGHETNDLITHTNIFVAAAEAAGVSDVISSYGSLGPRGLGSSRQAQVESGQGRMISTLWEDPQKYINCSAIFKADKITTPLLIMHNKADAAVPWGQGVEFYLALRRLGKKVWMLQYDGGEHSVNDNDAVDYTTRLTQYFDHYLKDAPAPVWMTQGIPARLKQIETGYAYDPSGNCGKNCRICKYWNEKFKNNSTACWKEIEQRKISEHWQ